MLSRVAFRAVEKNYEEIIRGNLDGEATILTMQVMMQFPHWLEFWEEFKPQLRPEYVEWFDANILDL